MRAGWTRNTLKIGDVVTVEGSRAKDKSHIGNARVVIARGDRQAPVRGVEPERQHRSTGISGAETFSNRGQNCDVETVSGRSRFVARRWCAVCWRPLAMVVVVARSSRRTAPAAGQPPPAGGGLAAAGRPALPNRRRASPTARRISGASPARRASGTFPTSPTWASGSSKPTGRRRWSGARRRAAARVAGAARRRWAAAKAEPAAAVAARRRSHRCRSSRGRPPSTTTTRRTSRSTTLKGTACRRAARA